MAPTSTGSNFGSRPMRSKRCATRSSPLEIAAHVRDGRMRHVVVRPLFHQLHPTTQTRERCPQLMRRLARHARPESLACRVVRVRMMNAPAISRMSAVTTCSIGMTRKPVHGPAGRRNRSCRSTSRRSADVASGGWSMYAADARIVVRYRVTLRLEGQIGVGPLQTPL